MSILNFFKSKCMVSDDIAHNITNRITFQPSMEDLQQRNAQKLEQAKSYMGTKWLLHPDNSPKRKEAV